VLVKRGVEKSSALSGVLISIVFGLIPLFVILLVSRELSVISSLNVSLLLFLLGAGAFSMFGRALSYLGVREIGATRTYPLTSTRVLFSAILAMLIFGEKITLQLGVGIILIFAGIYLLVSEVR
jgi:drug/metabolite transporter (DMT)-like permease